MNFSHYFRNFSSGMAWALMDTKCKYRRSVIGPFWETINVFVMMVGMTYVAAAIFHGSPLENLPFVGLGIIVWSAMTALVAEGAGTFIANKEYIRNSSLDLDVYTSRTVVRVFITFAHHLLLYFVGLVFLPIPLTATSLLAIPGLLLLFINALWVVPTVGFLCARFRDLEMIIRNLLQLIFFVTPIFWNFGAVGPDRLFIVRYNPFFYFLEAIRSPLLGHTLPGKHYVVMLGITIAGFVILSLVRRKMRRNLAFYV